MVVTFSFKDATASKNNFSSIASSSGFYSSSLPSSELAESSLISYNSLGF